MDMIELVNAMGMPEKVQKDAERRAAKDSEDAREWAHEAHMAAVERHRRAAERFSRAAPGSMTKR